MCESAESMMILPGKKRCADSVTLGNVAVKLTLLSQTSHHHSRTSRSRRSTVPRVSHLALFIEY